MGRYAVFMDGVAMRRWGWNQIRSKMYQIYAEVVRDSGTGAGLGCGNVEASGGNKIVVTGTGSI